MATINLRNFYPHYHTDVFIEVADDVVEAMLGAERQEAAYQLRKYRHKAYYSLDIGDEIEGAALFQAMSPADVYERKLTMQQLGDALNTIPSIQARRVYAHYILGMSMTKIAKDEGVAKSRISDSIKRGLQNLERLMKNEFR